MGFPATKYLAMGDRMEEFPFYVWLADNPDGPVWRLMDEEFDRWDRVTGRHVAFFVDPFQKEEWAVYFLQCCGLDPGLIQEILALLPRARNFYRGRLSRALCDSTRIGHEYLPFALISLRWNSPTCIACFLPGGNDLPRLFETLIRLSGGALESPIAQPGGRAIFDRTRQVRTALADERFDVRIFEIPAGPASSAGEAAHIVAEGKFLQGYHESLRWESERRPSRDRIQGFGLLKGDVFLTALDDLVGLATSLQPLTATLINRYPQDFDMVRLHEAVAHLNQALEKLDWLNGQFLLAMERRDDLDIDRAFWEFAGLTRSAGSEDRIAELLGPGVYAALEPESRDAIQASEVIYQLSGRLQRLQRDLTGVLVGYWKAMEREGRRLLLEAARRGHDLIFQDKENKRSLRPEEIGGKSLGDLGFILKTIEMAPPPAENPVLICRKAGKLMRRVSEGARNPYTHRDLLQDPERMESARSKAGCNNRNGVLPLLVEALAALGVVALVEMEDEAEEAV